MILFDVNESFSPRELLFREFELLLLLFLLPSPFLYFQLLLLLKEGRVLFLLRVSEELENELLRVFTLVEIVHEVFVNLLYFLRRSWRVDPITLFVEFGVLSLAKNWVKPALLELLVF